MRVGAECDARGEVAGGRGGGGEAEYARVPHMLRKCRREIKPECCRTGVETRCVVVLAAMPPLSLCGREGSSNSSSGRREDLGFSEGLQMRNECGLRE